jgi:phage terminase small subunit
MPRRSSASLTVLPPSIDAGKTRLKPSSNLIAAERELFDELVRGCAPNHFRETDRLLLEEYVREALLLQQAAEALRQNGAVMPDGKRINPWFQIQQRACKTMAVLATRLRLTPASRLHPKSVARQATPSHPAPWLNR